MTLSAQDAQAIAGVAQNLRVDPRVLGGLMELESGVNPNVWGGAGGQYRGLIQFGPGARKEVGLPDRPMSIAEQMPYVQKYLQQRGFKPGVHGATELYRTVLVGNPGQSGTDSFGTNSDAAAKRMMPGGDLYKRFAAKFDGVAGSAGGSSAVPATATATLSQGGGLAEPDFSEILGLAGLGSSGAAASLDPVSAAILAPLALTGDGGLRKAGGDAFLQALQTVGAAPDASAAVEPASSGDTSGGLDGRALAEPGGRELRTGNTGTSTGPHLDARWADGRPIAASDLDQFLQLGGKRPSEYQVTSGYGPRKAPTAGASTFHQGIDLGVGEGTPIAFTGGARLSKYLPSQGGAGNVALVQTPKGALKLLHLS